MDAIVKELIEATEEWHSIEDCKAEGRFDCRLCKAIEAAQQSVQPTKRRLGAGADFGYMIQQQIREK